VDVAGTSAAAANAPGAAPAQATHATNSAASILMRRTLRERTGGGCRTTVTFVALR
jgi:hypothetical protein